MLFACSAPISNNVHPSPSQLPSQTNSIPAITATATEVFRERPLPTATNIQLPYILITESSEYCQASPTSFISTSEAGVLSKPDIGHKLVEIWLNRYKTPDAHPYCKIEDFTIDGIQYNPEAPLLPLEPQGDFMMFVMFSVKLIQLPAIWMAFPGEIDRANWLHTSHAISIFISNTGYRMEFANP